LCDQLGDSVEASFDGVGIDERAQKPRAQEARAHTGDGDVESSDDGGGVLAGLFGENWRDEFEIANGDRIEDERVVLLVVADAIEVSECGLRGGVGGLCGVFADVVDDRACGRKSVSVIVEAKAGEFGNAELLAEDARGVIVLKRPIFNAAFDTARTVEKRGF